MTWARELNVEHSICIAFVLNLVVKKALDQTPGLADLRTKARKLVSLFLCSTTAKVYYMILTYSITHHALVIHIITIQVTVLQKFIVIVTELL